MIDFLNRINFLWVLTLFGVLILTGCSPNENDTEDSPTQTTSQSPLLSVPGNITVVAADPSGVAATQTAIVAFLDAATAHDEEDGAIVTITHDAPSLFPVGSTLVTFSVTDSDQNTASKVSTVTVNLLAGGNSGLMSRPANATECIAPDNPPVASSIQLVNPFPDLPALTSPLAMYQAPGDSSHWYVVQQSGQVLRFENSENVDAVTTFIDIADGRLVSGGERGLLGMTFHPDFSTNGYVYLSYTNNESGLVSRISRFSLAAGGTTLDPSSEQIILTVAQPYSNHNGGQISFGPDGYLYIGLGDGGSGGDPLGHGQDTNTLLGAMLRIDVGDGSSGTYSIPADNPFASSGGMPEIFAYGLRNPWRWSFDRVTGNLWLGDVGQGSYEEIDIITNGSNYGWNTMEGLHCYDAPSCDQTGLTLPVSEYDHSVGYSVTGGYVYRGSAIPFLEGQYLYADFSTGRIWALQQTGPDQYTSDELLDTSLNIASFAEDQDGELYVLHLGGGIRKIVGDNTNQSGQIPALLSDWQCFQAGDLSSFSEHVIPYDINALLWSDNADKGRFLAIPDGTTIDIDDEGRFELPVGSVIGKNFWLDNQVIETRLYLHHAQPHGWKGYSYEWNDSETEATLLSVAKDRYINGQTWHYPSQAECDACHTSVAGITLGPEVGQFNRLFTYPSSALEANQLITLEAINVFSNALTEEHKSTQFYALDDSNYSVERRARSYLHSNCANCHQPGGPGGGNMDLRMSVTLAEARICNEAPLGQTLGLADPVIVKPGDPDNSILVRRMEDLGQYRMPPLGSGVVDTQALNVIREWISQLNECP